MLGDTIGALRRALVQHKVLVFRRQAVTPAAHVAFACRFGDLEVHPVFPHHPDHPELVLLGGSARTHPESGEKSLYVNEAFTTRLANYVAGFEPRVGLEFKVAEMELLALLLRQATIPEYQMRLHWEPDTVVMWDNRSTQHYAIQDYFPAVRRMMRATVIGDRPR